MTDLETLLADASALSRRASSLAESVERSNPELAKTLLDILAPLRKTLGLIDYSIGRGANISVSDRVTLNEIQHGLLPEENEAIASVKMSNAAYRHQTTVLKALMGQPFDRRRIAMQANRDNLVYRHCREKRRSSFDTPESDNY